jgi:type I restriction enzyme, S subunit
MAVEVETLELIGDLPPSWRVARFGDVLEGGTRNGIYKSKAFHGRGAKIVNMGELFAHPRLRDVPMKRVELSDSEMEKSCLKKGDLLFARRSLVAEGAGKCIVVAEVKEPTTFESSIIRVRPNPQVVDSLFLYYLFNSPYGAYVLQTIRRQVAVSGITGTDLVELPVPLPPLAEQKAIAAVLGALDEKIELNRRMNATLEAMARALFQSWFVDFDPVRAKLDGREPVGLDSATAALFPESFHDSRFGHIPRGWEVSNLDKIANYLNGLALQKHPPGNGPTLPIIKIAQLRKGDCIGAHRCNTDLPPNYIVQDGDVLFSWSGSLEVELWCGGPGALNQHLFKVTSSEFPKWFYYLWTLNHLDEFRLIAADRATTMGHIQRGHISEAKVLIPPRPLLHAMTCTMTPLIEQLISSRIQSRSLATLRDTLLPKLLSGDSTLSFTRP